MKRYFPKIVSESYAWFVIADRKLKIFEPL